MLSLAVSSYVQEDSGEEVEDDDRTEETMLWSPLNDVGKVNCSHTMAEAVDIDGYKQEQMIGIHYIFGCGETVSCELSHIILKNHLFLLGFTHTHTQIVCNDYFSSLSQLLNTSICNPNI